MIARSFIGFTIPAGMWTLALGVLSITGVQLTAPKLIVFGILMIVTGLVVEKKYL